MRAVSGSTRGIYTLRSATCLTADCPFPYPPCRCCGVGAAMWGSGRDGRTAVGESPRGGERCVGACPPAPAHPTRALMSSLSRPPLARRFTRDRTAEEGSHGTAIRGSSKGRRVVQPGLLLRLDAGTPPGLRNFHRVTTQPPRAVQRLRVSSEGRESSSAERRAPRPCCRRGLLGPLATW